MTGKRTIIRLEATYDLRVQTGDRVGVGDRLCAGPADDESSAAPIAGIVRSIRLDPDRHEFVIVIAAD